MKNLLIGAATCLASLSFSSCYESQEIIKQVDCSNRTDIKAQGEEAKKKYAKDGFTVIREMYVSVKNDYETPIMFMMQNQGLYALIFVGEPKAKKWELQLRYHDQGGLVSNQKNLQQDGNVMSFAYRADITGGYNAFLYQRMPDGPDNLCGYFILMKKTETVHK